MLTSSDPRVVMSETPSTRPPAGVARMVKIQAAGVCDRRGTDAVADARARHAPVLDDSGVFTAGIVASGLGRDATAPTAPARCSFAWHCDHVRVKDRAVGIGAKQPPRRCRRPHLQLPHSDRGSHDDRAGFAYTRRHECRSRPRRRRPSRISPIARRFANVDPVGAAGHRDDSDPRSRR